MLIDHHTHTKPFSFDGQQTLDALLSATQSRGLAGVCLTDHYEKDVRYRDGVEAIFNLDAYYLALRRLKAAGRARGLEVLMGIELGHLPHLTGHFRSLVLRYPFDAVIGSIHILDGEDPYDDPAPYRQGKQALYDRYLEQLTDMTLRGPDFDILGHFDYICRYAPWSDRKITWAAHSDRLEVLFRALIDRGRTLEVNTATVYKLMQLGYSQKEAWPDTDLIQAYRALGGEHICLSSDAHQDQDVGRLFASGLAWLEAMGFRQLTFYRGRQAIQTPLSAITPPA